MCHPIIKEKRCFWNFSPRWKEREILEMKNRQGEENASTVPTAYSCRAALLRLYLKTSACFG